MLMEGEHLELLERVDGGHERRNRPVAFA